LGVRKRQGEGTEVRRDEGTPPLSPLGKGEDARTTGAGAGGRQNLFFTKTNQTNRISRLESPFSPDNEPKTNQRKASREAPFDTHAACLPLPRRPSPGLSLGKGEGGLIAEPRTTGWRPWLPSCRPVGAVPAAVPQSGTAAASRAGSGTTGDCGDPHPASPSGEGRGRRGGFVARQCAAS